MAQNAIFGPYSVVHLSDILAMLGEILLKFRYEKIIEILARVDHLDDDDDDNDIQRSH